MRIGGCSSTVIAHERFGCVDVTDDLDRAVKDSGVTDGVAVAYCGHTTCALMINEWEKGALEDFRKRLTVLVPGEIYYAHDDFDRRTENMHEGHERPNGAAHVMQMIVGGSSHVIPVSEGRPRLGRWQRLFLIELDQPRERTVYFQVFGD